MGREADGCHQKSTQAHRGGAVLDALENCRDAREAPQDYDKVRWL